MGISCFITFLCLANVLIQHDLQQVNETEWSLVKKVMEVMRAQCVYVLYNDFFFPHAVLRLAHIQ